MFALWREIHDISIVTFMKKSLLNPREIYCDIHEEIPANSIIRVIDGLVFFPDAYATSISKHCVF
jgi:hypothetical protein